MSSASVIFARPKSATHTLAIASSSRFEGLISRCNTPRRLAYSIACATWSPSRATLWKNARLNSDWDPGSEEPGTNDGTEEGRRISSGTNAAGTTEVGPVLSSMTDV